LSENHHATIHKILILQTAFIGDVILTIPLIKVVSEQFPQAEIHFITIPASKELVETLPWIHKLWIFDKRGENSGIRQLLKYSQRLKSEKFDIALIPHRSLRSAILVCFAGIRQRIGFHRSTGKWLFTDRVFYTENRHEIERNLSLLDPIGKFPVEIPLPEIMSTKLDLESISNWLENNNVLKDKPFICFAPGSIWPTKRWPEEYWRVLAKNLNEMGIPIILIGSEQDKYLANEIINSSKNHIYSAMGIFSIRQSAELIRQSSLLISNDSAPTHLGVAVRTPVLTIFGSTVPAFGFYPYGKQNKTIEIPDLDCRPCTDHGRYKCPLGHFKCMQDISPKQVFQVAVDMIDANFTNKSG
jgi:heptosyltransferase-2